MPSLPPQVHATSKRESNSECSLTEETAKVSFYSSGLWEDEPAESRPSVRPVNEEKVPKLTKRAEKESFSLSSGQKEMTPKQQAISRAYERRTRVVETPSRASGRSSSSRMRLATVLVRP